MTSTASPSPARALLALRDQVDARWPRRQKASDGLMGDAEHQKRASDHNDGNAMDITHDVKDGPDLDELADVLIDDERVHYVIWNRRIRNREFEAGAWRPYSGASPHTHHLHVSIHANKRDDTAPWKLARDPATREADRTDAHKGIILVGLGLFVAAALFVHHSEREAPPQRPYRPTRY